MRTLILICCGTFNREKRGRTPFIVEHLIGKKGEKSHLFWNI